MSLPEEEIKSTYSRGYLMLLEQLVSLRPTVFSELRDTLRGIHSATIGWIQRWIPDSYTKGRERALKSRVTPRTVNQVGPRQNIPEGQHRRDIEALAYNLYGDLTDSLQLVGRRISDRLREIGLEETLAGRVAGESSSTRMRERLEQEGITGITDSAGRQWRPDTYAEMAARTTLAEAENLGMINQLEEEGVDLVRITEHAGSCGICAQYEGRVYSISGRSESFPPLKGTAFSVAYNIIHPNCRHDLEAYRESDDADAQRTRADSNKPFTDDRSQQEKDAYQQSQNRKRKARERKRKQEEESLNVSADTPTQE